MINDTSKAFRFFIFISVGFVLAALISFIIINDVVFNRIEIDRDISINAEIEHISNYKALTLLTINEREYFIDHAKLLDSSSITFQDFVHTGDYIVKDSQSDTLIISRKGEKYIFILE